MNYLGYKLLAWSRNVIRLSAKGNNFQRLRARGNAGR
jgi:hypothetical protein